MLRRQKHALSQSMAPSACTLGHLLRSTLASLKDPGTVTGAASVRGRRGATNLRLKTPERQAANGSPLATFQCVPARGVENSGRKNQPKEEVSGWISLRTSSQNLRSGLPNPGRNKLGTQKVFQ